MKKTINELVVDFMNFLEIKYCFGIPGSNMSLLKNIESSKTIKLILSKTEQGASFMASGFSKSSGLPSCCFGSVGPGATNLVTGVAAAYYDSQPLLVLSGQVKTNFFGKMGFQESVGKGRSINQLNIFKEITKSAKRINKKKDIFEALKNSYFALKAERPGPAYLEIPSDLMEEFVEIPNGLFKNFEKENKKRLEKKEPVKKLKFIAKKISESNNPLILIGGGALNYQKEIINFVKKTNIPFVTTLKGRGIISENNLLSLGSVGISGQNSANEYIKTKADLLIVFGASLGQFTTHNWDPSFKKLKIIRFDVLTQDLTKNYLEESLVLGNISKNLSVVSLEINRKWKHSLEEVRKYRKKGYFEEQKINPGKDSDLTRILISRLREILPKDSIICSESIFPLEKNFKIYFPRTQIVCTGFGPIGGSLSEAVGSKFANDSRIVVSLEGDGGFQMAAMELLTSFNYSKPILAIVLNNGILGPVYNQQMKVYGKSFMSEFKGADYKKLSEGLKTEYVCIKNDKEIDFSIKEALEKIKKGSSVLMEVVLNK